MYSENNVNNRYSDIQQYESFEQAEQKIKEIANNPEAMKQLSDNFSKLTDWFISSMNEDKNVNEKK